MQPPIDGQGAPQKPRKSPWIWVLIAVVGLCLVCIFPVAAILFPVFGQARIAAKMSATQSDLRQFGMSLAIYTVDFDDKYPPKMGNMQEVFPYVSRYFKRPLPSSGNPGHPEFEGNAAVAGEVSTKIPAPDKLFLFFDSAPWQNQKRIVLFGNSAVRKVTESDFQLGLGNGYRLK